MAKTPTAIATKQMTLPGFKVTAVGLVANKDITPEQIDATGDILAAVYKRDLGKALPLIADHIATEGKRWERT